MQSPRPPCRRRSPSLQVRWAAGRGSRDSSAVKPRGHCPACGGGAGGGGGGGGPGGPRPGGGGGRGGGGRRPGPSGAAGREGAGVAGQLPCGCHPEPQRGEVRAAPPYALRVLVLGGGGCGAACVLAVLRWPCACRAERRCLRGSLCEPLRRRGLAAGGAG